MKKKPLEDNSQGWQESEPNHGDNFTKNSSHQINLPLKGSTILYSLTQETPILIAWEIPIIELKITLSLIK